MIQPLRTIHRRTFLGLAIVLPGILWAALAARPVRLGPDNHLVQLPPAARFLRTTDQAWSKHRVSSEFYGDPNNSNEIFIALHPQQDLNEPDLLLYWSDSEAQGNKLPAQSRLLGAFSPGKAVALPREDGQSGHLTLYSLPNQAVVDTAAVEQLP